MASLESSSGLSTQELTELQVYRQILNNYTNSVLDAKKAVKIVEDRCYSKKEIESCEYLEMANNKIDYVVQGIKKRVGELENKIKNFQNKKGCPTDFLDSKN